MTVSYKGHSGTQHHEVSAFCWSPGGSHIASAALLDHRLHVWSTTRGAKDRTYDLPADVSAVAWSRNGTIMAGDQSGLITLWHNPQTRVVDVVKLHRTKPARYAKHQTSPNYEWINSSVLGRHKVWESPSIATIAPSPKGDFAFSASGSLSVANAGTGRIWDMASLAEYCIDRDLSSVTAAWSPDGTRLACSVSGSFTIHKVPGGDELLRRDWQNPGGGKTEIHHGAIAWSPDGTMVATNNGILQIWDTATWQPIASCDDRRHVASVSWSPDSTRLALAAQPPQATLRIFHVRSGKITAEPVMAPIGDFIGPAAWSPVDDRIAYPASKGTIHVIEIA